MSSAPLFTMNQSEYWFCSVQFGASIRIAMYEQIISFLRDGIPLHDLLSKLGNEYTKAKKGDPRGMVFSELAAALNNSVSLSAALTNWAPTAETTLIQAGEDSGLIVQAFENAIFATKATQEMKSVVVKALAYPAALLAGLGGLLSLYAFKVMPTIANIASPELWPKGAQAFYSLCNFVRDDLIYTMPFVTAVLIGISLTLPRLVGPARRYLDYIPPYNLYRAFHSSIFLISLAALMASGTPINESVQSVKAQANKYVRGHLSKILTAFGSGMDAGDSLNASGFLGFEMAVAVKVYASTGSIKEKMKSIGESAIRDSIAVIARVSMVINTVIMLLVVGCMMWAITSVNAITGVAVQMAGG